MQSSINAYIHQSTSKEQMAQIYNRIHPDKWIPIDPILI